MSRRVTRSSSLENASTIPPRSSPIDVDSFDDDDDDDVIVLSPRSFAEGRNRSRRNRVGTVVDLDAETSSRNSTSTNPSDRIPPNPPVINCESHEYVNLRNLYISMREPNRRCHQLRQQAAQPPPPPRPPPSQEPAFSCPICMGPLVEEMSTQCGHIFCKKCIVAAIGAQGKCPTCRRKVSMREIHRVFLPTTS